VKWFDVDKSGLRKILERYGVARVLIELVSNALDTDAKLIEVSVNPVKNKSLIEVEVVDDDPNGFKNLEHAWTLFAESNRKGDPTKRGRFNLGEKLVLACCEEARIESVTGGVRFDKDGRHAIRKKREKGSRFWGLMKLTREELAEAETLVNALFVPPGVKLFYNNVQIVSRDPICTFEATLPTEKSDDDGRLKPTKRKTTVRVYDPEEDEVASVYELGVPVVELDGEDPWHIDVEQKVPLTMDRTNVKPGFLQQIRVEVLNRMHEQVSEEQASQTWARAATGDERVEKDAVQSMKTKRFGEKAVAYDPSDPEANKIAMSQGYTVITGGALSGEEWNQFKKHEVTQAAGRVTPSPTAYSSDPNAETAKFAPKDKWSFEMKAVANHVEKMAEELMGAAVVVKYNTSSNNFAAAWCDSFLGATELHFSLKKLGRQFFKDAMSNRSSQIRLHDIMLHEFAHHYCSDHFSHEFLNAATRLGAKLTELALRRPELFRLID
jgi:hypothetical protein